MYIKYKEHTPKLINVYILIGSRVRPVTKDNHKLNIMNNKLEISQSFQVSSNGSGILENNNIFHKMYSHKSIMCNKIRNSEENFLENFTIL